MAVLDPPINAVPIEQARSHGSWKFNYLVGAILTAPFVPPVAALLALLFVLAALSDRQFESAVVALETATTDAEAIEAATEVVRSGCSGVALIALVSIVGVILLIGMGVGL